MIFKRKQQQKTITKKIDTKRSEEYEVIGKLVVDLYDAVNPAKATLYKTAFLKGVLTGVGGVVGATVVIAILLWALSLFDSVPLIGDFFDSVENTIQQGQP